MVCFFRREEARDEFEEDEILPSGSDIMPGPSRVGRPDAAKLVEVPS